MEGTNGLPNLMNMAYAGRYAPLSPFPFLPAATSHSDSPSVESKRNFKYGEAANYHQRSSSESFLIEEQPSWFDDLLNESETVVHRGHHRHRASDSFLFLGDTAESFAAGEESKYVSANVETSTRSHNLARYKDADRTSIDTKTTAPVEKNSQFFQESEEVTSSSEHSRDEPSSQYPEGSADKASASQPKPSGSKSEAKPSKQHNAHRSRVRKLQYIGHLERTVEMLKAEGTGILAELEFIEQQNMILTMENRALRQRLESLSQEQLIKNWEQGMLEREIGRLQALYHLQKQQQMHPQYQQMPHNQQGKQRRNKSKDFDQVNSSSMKNKDTASSKNPVNVFVRA